MRALLDVNVLIALMDRAHTMHRKAWSWLGREIAHGWSSCPITQNAVIRIMTQPAYPGHLPVPVVAHRLAEACASPDHRFLPDDISLLGIGSIDWRHVLGHRQVTDTYLLALAAHHGVRFVTFDRRISPQSLAGVDAHTLEVIG
ncbi:VapC toxin family PIN domain ribonuclease [Thioalkalivibrio denitrificans]|uniref:Ribonuclease VapC n=1 Tax=Thioalkalivibrio denitrificans TaxID=108003 RepID=A0A1V3N6S4_9GAMM|nr:TA system VapC family ribonuclease toxin [Thioalkalivibrio denitrificans]OOG20799.1 VapC toxin family PIN domain ribonuclease [Thioalkalivibrio denitrificans]